MIKKPQLLSFTFLNNCFAIIMAVVCFILSKLVDLVKKVIFENIVNALDAYIKSIFENGDHLDQCCYTKSIFSIDVNAIKLETCAVCMLPIRIMHYLSSQVDSLHRSLRDDCRKKLVLYMTHQCWVVSQRAVLNTILPTSTVDDVLAVLDFKKKFEAKYFLETTSDWHGKKDLSWCKATLHFLCM